jgi:hypothetical protein
MKKETKKYDAFIGFRAKPEVRSILDHLAMGRSKPGQIATLSDVLRDLVKSSPAYQAMRLEMFEEALGQEIQYSEKVAA